MTLLLRTCAIPGMRSPLALQIFEGGGFSFRTERVPGDADRASLFAAHFEQVPSERRDEAVCEAILHTSKMVI